MVPMFKPASQYYESNILDDRNEHIKSHIGFYQRLLCRDLEHLGAMAHFSEELDCVRLSDPSGKIQLRLDLHDEDLVEVFYVEAAQDLKGHEGRIMFRNVIEYAKHLAYESVRFEVGGEIGGYAWAKCGVKFSDVDDGYHYKIKAGLLRSLQEKVEAIDECLSPRVAQKLNKWTQSVEILGEHLYEVSNLQMDVLPYIQRIVGNVGSSELEVGHVEKFLHNTLRLRRVFERSTASLLEEYQSSSNEVKLGQYLLIGEKWDGMVDLSDQKQLNRIQSYAGAFKYIEMESSSVRADRHDLIVNPMLTIA